MRFTFTAPLWLYHGKGAWMFITLPKPESARIKLENADKRRGWGMVRIRATIGKTHWGTSVFPDSKAGAYLLPVKADIRKKEKITAGENVTVTIETGK